jgi:dihydrofolate reductase
MRRIVVTEHLTLDGVMQAPGDVDEDRRGGFEHGGWHTPYFDQDFMELVGPSIAQTDAYLFGRWTFESMASYWSEVPAGDAFGDTLNGTPKYVVSSTLQEPLGWRNSELLRGDLVEVVGEIKERPGGDIAVLGSGQLVRSLLQHRLVDELLLTIDPLVLGTGRRLFAGVDTMQRFELVDARPTSTGVLVATYRPSSGEAGEPGASRGTSGQEPSR